MVWHSNDRSTLGHVAISVEVWRSRDGALVGKEGVGIELLLLPFGMDDCGFKLLDLVVGMG